MKNALRRWSVYDERIDILTPVEKVHAKVLYSALKHLNNDERQLLAEKYRDNGLKYIADPILARNRNISLKDYQELRRSTENKLLPFYKTYRKKYENELEQAFEEEYKDERKY